MKIRIYFIVALLAVACSSKKRDYFEYRSSKERRLSINKENKKFIIDNFKDKVFCKCLLEGYKENKIGDSIFKLMAKKDLFTLSDDVDLKRDSLVKELAVNVIKNLPEPRVHTETDITGKNFIITSCLRYFDSRELDSIAEQYYEQRIDKEERIWGKSK